MGFLGMINCYTLRVNLSVAIVAMVNTTYLAELEASAREENDTSPHSVCDIGAEEPTILSVHDSVVMGNMTNMTIMPKSMAKSPVEESVSTLS